MSLLLAFPASSNKHSRNCSLRKPGLAIKTHFKFSIVMCFMNPWTTREKKRAKLLSCCELKPFRFRAIWSSIFDLTMVIVEVSKQILARPSCLKFHSLKRPGKSWEKSYLLDMAAKNYKFHTTNLNHERKLFTKKRSKKHWKNCRIFMNGFLNFECVFSIYAKNCVLFGGTNIYS